MNARQLFVIPVILFGAAIFAPNHALAQQPQIPTLQVCNTTVAEGGGAVFLAGRQDAAHSGFFKIQLVLRCDPKGPGYPSGALSLSIDLSDSNLVQVDATTFEQVTSTGRYTPTAYMNGRCKAFDEAGAAVPGCRFWLMVADNVNPETPDIVGFLVFDGTGKRISYGTGPLIDGDIFVAPTGF